MHEIKKKNKQNLLKKIKINCVFKIYNFQLKLEESFLRIVFFSKINFFKKNQIKKKNSFFTKFHFSY